MQLILGHLEPFSPKYLCRQPNTTWCQRQWFSYLSCPTLSCEMHSHLCWGLGTYRAALRTHPGRYVHLPPLMLDSSPLPAVSAPLAAGNAQPVMASRGCWRWDSPTLARVCVRWDWSVRWSSPTARPGACPFGPPLSYQIAREESLFHAGRETAP